MSYKDTYNDWLQNPYFDEATKEELRAIADDEKEIEDRFYRQLEFGTGGLRGVIGAGTNRMNIYTVRQATQGLANYIISQNGQEKGVAIAYDSRIMSPEFATEAALCLNANGIKTYRFTSLRPTPELSFAVRKLGCIAGIVVTASHNPREYNGYKVYWEDGAQITPPHDKNILAEVAKVTSFDLVKTMEKADAVAAGYYTQAQADQIAKAQAESYMNTIPDDGSGSGAQQAATMASSTITIWKSNQIGSLANGQAVCIGYANAFSYLLQCATPKVYLKDGKTDINAAENWKTYEELNYVLDSDGNPVKDENGDPKWDATKTAAIVDMVRIQYNPDFEMFGHPSSAFDAPHYWNAVRVNGKWYYIDTCYSDIYIETLVRTRVETNGNMNHMFFMFSDDSARKIGRAHV